MLLRKFIANFMRTIALTRAEPSARREPPALRLRISIAMSMFLALGFALGIKQLNTRTA